MSMNKIKNLIKYLITPFFRLINLYSKFKFCGKKYKYFIDAYNITGLNERAIEIPIIMEELKKYSGKKILEVGNVLSHYCNFKHDIIDKYEKAEGVINEDIKYFCKLNYYDFIICISTLEHVGYDETCKDKNKIKKVIQNLERSLAVKGRIIITLPLGYNIEMDKMIKNKEIIFPEQYFFKKISWINHWQEFTEEHITYEKYNYFLHSARELMIGIIKK